MIKKIKSILIILIICTPLFGQSQNSKENECRINFSIENMGVLAFNDRWFITTEGYHIHPASEKYTPGLKIGIEKNIIKNVNVEIQVLYCRPTAYLGIIDQFSSREVHTEEGYNFISVLLSVNLSIVKWEKGNFYISPTLGYGSLSKISLSGSFVPQVDYGGNGRFIYGAKTGINIGLFENRDLSFRSELTYLSMKLKIFEPLSAKELTKLLGPIGISIGISYLL
jgi:hypothetical protein